jgi:hypothetical protein
MSWADLAPGSRVDIPFRAGGCLSRRLKSNILQE